MLSAPLPVGSMILEIDAASPLPPYEQIRTQVATMITTRVMAPGSRLPAIRQLSKDLGLATGTVARAYRELEAEGLIGATRGCHGTFVTESRRTRNSETDEDLAQAARAFAIQARQLGADAGRALELAREAFESL